MEKLENFFKIQPDIQMVYQFGSSLTKDQHEESDIDLAILFDTKPDHHRMLEITEKLTDILNKEIDLSMLNDASPIFSMQVISKGKTVFCSSSKIKSYFIIRTANEYDDLQYFRHFQIKNILKGKVFA